jgi:hypothetical protein
MLQMTACSNIRDDNMPHMTARAPLTHCRVVLPALQPFFEAMHRVLRPGGIICTQAESLWLHMDIIHSLAGMCKKVRLLQLGLLVCGGCMLLALVVMCPEYVKRSRSQDLGLRYQCFANGHLLHRGDSTCTSTSCNVATAGCCSACILLTHQQPSLGAYSTADDPAAAFSWLFTLLVLV